MGHKQDPQTINDKCTFTLTQNQKLSSKRWRTKGRKWTSWKNMVITHYDILCRCTEYPETLEVTESSMYYGKWFPIREKLILNDATMMHKCTNKLVPDYLADMLKLIIDKLVRLVPWTYPYVACRQGSALLPSVEPNSGTLWMIILTP